MNKYEEYYIKFKNAASCEEAKKIAQEVANVISIDILKGDNTFFENWNIVLQMLIVLWNTPSHQRIDLEHEFC